MAVNDKKFTQKVKSAGDYFNNLVVSEERAVKIDNSDMVETAGYVAAIFSEPDVRKRIIEKTEIPKFSNIDETTVRDVINMCTKYSEGLRKFDDWTPEAARRLCRVLVEYVETLEKQNP